jgi:hypothetical protein
MKRLLSFTLLLVQLHAQVVAQESNSTMPDGVEDEDDDSETLVSDTPSESPSSTLFPTEEGSFNDTDIGFLDPEEPTFSPGGSPGSQQQPPPPPQQQLCRSLGIHTESDCHFACLGFPYTVLYQTASPSRGTGEIEKYFGGFHCQCLQAVPPIDCIFYYQFSTCQEVGIFDCRLEGFPVISQEDPKEYSKQNITDNNMSNNSTAMDVNSTSGVTKATSCAAYCRDLGFVENPDDSNDNDYDSFCTRHDLHNWTSCACGVVITLDSGRSVSIEDGMYVCGDAGFEEGLTFETFSGSARLATRRIERTHLKVVMATAIVWLIQLCCL